MRIRRSMGGASGPETSPWPRSLPPGTIIMILLFITAGCEGQGLYMAGAERSTGGFIQVPGDREEPEPARQVDSEPLVTGRHSAAPPETPQEEGIPPTKRLLVYDASLKIQVPNLEEARKGLFVLVEEKGGYLQRQENQSFTCRIPAAHFNPVLEALRGFGALLYENIQARDVTRQYLDLEIRLENALKSRERLLELLNRTDKVADLLEVERELKRLTEEIERMKGEIRYLKDQVAYSTIQVTLNGPVTEGRSGRPVRNRFAWINRIGVEYVLEHF